MMNDQLTGDLTARSTPLFLSSPLSFSLSWRKSFGINFKVTTQIITLTFPQRNEIFE